MVFRLLNSLVFNFEFLFDGFDQSSNLRLVLKINIINFDAVHSIELRLIRVRCIG